MPKTLMNKQSQGTLKKQLLKLDQMGNQLIGIIKLKFCFSQTTFVTPPPALDSVISIGILAEEIPAPGRGVGIR